jgi:hypothetical protein
MSQDTNILYRIQSRINKDRVFIIGNYGERGRAIAEHLNEAQLLILKLIYEDDQEDKTP